MSKIPRRLPATPWWKILSNDEISKWVFEAKQNEEKAKVKVKQNNNLDW